MNQPWLLYVYYGHITVYQAGIICLSYLILIVYYSMIWLEIDFWLILNTISFEYDATRTKTYKTQHCHRFEMMQPRNSTLAFELMEQWVERSVMKTSEILFALHTQVTHTLIRWEWCLMFSFWLLCDINQFLGRW